MNKRARRVTKARPAAKARSASAPKREARTRPAAAATVAASPAGPCRVVLDASCTLRETVDLQRSLAGASGDPVVLDGGNVERIDTAGLQLLVALACRQQHRGQRLEWSAASTELLKCGERLGLIDALGLRGIAGGMP